MTESLRPRLRAIESFPVGGTNGDVQFALRDPQGFAGAIVIPYPAAVLASLMDGNRTLEEIQDAFARQFGEAVAIEDLLGLIEQLDQRLFLDTPLFRACWKQKVEQYLNSPVRPAAHAGNAYAADAEGLRRQLGELFVPPAGPGVPGEPNCVQNGSELLGILSPHIDLHRGGTAFAWAYKRLVDQSDADLFVIFGTAHSWMRYLFSVTRKHFDTPLGTVETDLDFVARLAAKLKSKLNGSELDLFASDLVHRHEHSIEFQVVFLQYLLGDRRPFKIVPILTGSFHELVAESRQPRSVPEVIAFVSALRETAAEHQGKVCYISGGDLAHIGRRFGDRDLLDQPRLDAQSRYDLQLLETACRADSAAFFDHVAREQDRNRICGLSPTYTMLEVMQPKRGELLKYGQAVDPNGTSCVSFGSLAFYGQ